MRLQVTALPWHKCTRHDCNFRAVNVVTVTDRPVRRTLAVCDMHTRELEAAARSTPTPDALTPYDDPNDTSLQQYMEKAT